MQKTEDFGGPACAEMVLDYTLGPVNNQETHAEDMGTDHNGTEIHNLVGVLT